MLGGYFAHRGYLDLGGVIATAFVAAQGLRIALPVALGLTSMDARKFFWLNLLSASVWSCVFAFVGFGTSRLVTGIVDNLHHYEKWIAVGVLLVAALILWLRWHGARRTQG